VVPSVHDPLVDTFQNLSGVKESSGDISLWGIGVAETEDVGVENRFSALAGPQDVPVHTHDTRDGSAVRV
jgi:hypothetical protein